MSILEAMDLQELQEARFILIAEAYADHAEFTDFEQSVLKGLIGAICRIKFDRETLAFLNAAQLEEFNQAANQANLMNRWFEENRAITEVWLAQLLQEDGVTDEQF